MTQCRRMMCMLLTLVMIVSLIPLAVTAEDVPETYTVHFKANYNGAPKIPDQVVTAGACITEPQNVTRTGWDFQYWYVKTADGIQRFDPTKPVTEDLILYARWKENTAYWGPIWDAGLRNASQNKPADQEPIKITVDGGDSITTTDPTPTISGSLSTLENVVDVTWKVTATQDGKPYSKTGLVTRNGKKLSFTAPLVPGENEITVIVHTKDGTTYKKTITYMYMGSEEMSGSQTYTVTGRLVSAEDGTPAPYTHMSLSSSKHLYKDRSDANGYFQFEAVEAFDSYTLTAGDKAYYEYYLDNSVSIQKDTNLGNIALTPVPFEEYRENELRVRFIDSETGEVIPLQDIFEDFIDSWSWDIFVSDDTQLDDYYGMYTQQGHLDLDTDEVYFCGLKESDTYYLWIHHYFLNYNEPDEIQTYGGKHDVDYPYISVSGLTQVTYTLTKREEQLSYLDYDPLLWVMNERVTSENAADILGDDTVSYDMDTKTLTLNNANLYCHANTCAFGSAIISYIDGLNIVIPEGTTTKFYYESVEDSGFACIALYDECSITGGGTLQFVGSDHAYVAGIDREGRQLYIANVSMGFGANTEYGIADMHGGEDPALILLHNANLYTSEDKHDFFSSILQNGRTSLHCKGVIGISENTTIHTWHDDWGRCIDARGDVYIKDSTIHMTAENMGNGYSGYISYMLYGECSTVQITGNTSISLITDNTDRTANSWLLAAQELIIDPALVITNENGEVCQIVTEYDADTIRLPNGTYPTSVFVGAAE